MQPGLKPTGELNLALLAAAADIMQQSQLLVSRIRLKRAVI